jgi:glutaconyl-CoA/methylmalonyl-CoA decarboxylase subunit gamma
MKKLRITVNNKVYDVTVQVLEDDEQTVSGAGYLNPLPTMPPVQNPSARVSPAASPTVTAKRPPIARPAGDVVNLIAAPIAGTVQKIFVETGANIEAKSPVILLDAMKMDTYIYAPRAGEIAEICVAVKDSVQVGDALVRYKPEA